KIRWAARLGPTVIKMLARTWRITTHNAETFADSRRASQPVIFAFWHANILPLLWQHRNEGVAVLISTHADGEIIARICEAFGYRTIRGSTSRGGARALVEIARALEGGVDVAITPDGPRGPVHTVAPGTLYTAQRAKAPVIAIGVHASRAWRLSTWDRFMIPKPFARVTLSYGKLVVPNERDEALLDREGERLASMLQQLGAVGA
ncbi:MAG: lysophospholipid acyltransferase family protein, partial [Gemmatimonadota bacterium]